MQGVEKLVEADTGYSKQAASEAWPHAAWYVRGLGRCATPPSNRKKRLANTSNSLRLVGVNKINITSYI